MSDTLAPDQHSYLLKQYPTICAVTDQRSSNDCFNCTRKGGLLLVGATSNQDGNETSAACTYLTQGLFFVLIYYTPSVLLCCKFYQSIQLTFFRILIQKRFVLWSNTLSQSFQWYRPFSIPCHLSLHFLKNCFPKVGISMRIIWYYGIIKSGKRWFGKCMVHGLMDTVLRTKTKTLPLLNIRVCYFFCAVYHSKNHVISHPVIAAFLEVILNILQRWKTMMTCQSNFPNTTENCQKIVTNCKFDFRLNFALNGGHLGHHL